MPNRLAEESSPYLLQHANNPVQWFPWGEQALGKAKSEDKPIFLSIGYSACHWCHVMEHESFENDAIAQFLNDNFVSIKVDREERPDLDQIYMQAVMAVQKGQGGWPLSAFLTPDCHLFFGGTYWPPNDSRGMPGFSRVLQSVLDAFQNRRDQVEEQSRRVTEYLQEGLATSGDASLGEALDLNEQLLQTAGASLERIFDFTHGGFGRAPKFPHSMDLQLLLRLDRRQRENQASQSQQRADDENNSRWLQMVRLNLDKMALGGIYDHLAGGFARYSVDERWLVPHFEKMLYDNGLLMETYLDAWLVTRKPLYERVLRETLDYQLKYMTDPAGGFHSTEDADSEGVEGKFYVWSPEEIEAVLGAEDGALFCEVYDVTPQGNFEGKNILNLQRPLEEWANEKGIAEDDFLNRVSELRAKLLTVRDQRVRPGKDDKILVSWNSLMIPAMARAGVIFNEPRFLTAAQNAGQFVLEQMVSKDGALLHTWRHGVGSLPGYLDDYAYWVNALITLFECDGDSRWLEHANRFAAIAVDKFEDSQAGGFFFTASDAEQLIARSKEYQDSSVPSGNSMMSLALIRLAALTGNEAWERKARQAVAGAMELIQRAPSAAGQMLCAIDQLITPGQQVVVTASDADFARISSWLQNRYQPHRTVCRNTEALRASGVVSEQILAGKIDNQNDPDPTTASVYVCQDFSCQPPVIGMEDIERKFADQR